MLTRLRRALDRRSGALWCDPAPIRAELFSVERLEAHARSLALAQPVAERPRAGRSLAGRLRDNQDRLVEAYGVLQRSGADGGAVTPAAQWLLDNFHLVEEQIREIRRDLPPAYYRQLPKLISGPFAGYPRVLGLVWAFVAHTDSRFDVEMLQRYVNAYQAVHPLAIGELWAVAITLRVILVENLRRLADRILDSRQARRDADAAADRLLGAYGRDAEPVDRVLEPWADRRLPEAFAVQLLHRLRDQDSSLAPALTWLDDRLAAQGASGDAVVRGEHERQVAASGTVRNIITSLRRISEVDWLELVERMSLVDAALSRSGDFAEMDFPTRNLYRTAIEDLARGSGKSEIEVTRTALAAARACHGDTKGGHVGCHLIGSGRRPFEAALGFRPPLRALLGHAFQRLGVAGYAAVILLAAAAILAPPLLFLQSAGLHGAWLAGLAALALFPALELAVAVVNAVVTHSVRATFLPALELASGVPSEHRTLLVVPMMLTSPEAVREQVEGLEIHHLASVEGDVHFALLSDWTDADQETLPGDAELLALAADGVAALNGRYGVAPGGDRFLLLHRRRVWNESEQRWIGWERKRGKLHELNRLLRGSSDTTFVAPSGRKLTVPQGVRYVITLDADTRLPHDTVRRLIGKMAHPLNRPRVDPAARRVVEGYGILQPRITPALPVRNRGSRFLRLFSASSGIDPYAAAVSDVYQDLFGEGSYAGKGIYDVDAFEAALAGRVPECTLLSHDLFEGVYARAGLVSDVEVVEDAPTRYDVAALRHHRWARGDWQLLPWILGVPAGRCPAPASVPLIGRLKMLDNLRRTLTAPAATAALLAGWALLGGHAAAWTLFILGAFVAPALMPLIDDLAPRRPGIRARDRLKAMASDLRLALARALLLVVVLPHQAWLMSDAIVRTLWRLFVSRRRLLQWTPAAQLANGLRLDVAAFYRRMGGAVAIALAGLGTAGLWAQEGWPLAAGVSLGWLLAPLVALRISRIEPLAEAGELTEADARALRLIARRTWRYFETYVTAADNHLPPDNFQEDPPAVAHRTSPTNIGLYLLSTACARDLGWIGEGEALERIEATLGTLARMDRHRGHFLNWYDTGDLRPLDPQYVSTVDSGNLAGCLLSLASGCREWRDRPLSLAARWTGLADAVDLAREEVAPLCAPEADEHETWLSLDRALEALVQSMRGGEEADARAALDDVLSRWAGLAAPLQALLAEREAAAELAYWLGAAEATLRSHRRDLDTPDRDRRLADAEAAARRIALEMEYGFLLDPDRKLLSIGYRIAEGAQDANCYDLLASEARLASFLAIAKGDVPARHWFRLGHAVTPVADGAALISWSGSMFEYLMPALVMRSPTGSLLERSLRTVVRRQIEYGRSQGRPWGVSESAFNARDLELTYQYSNFGIPGLGLKRGLGEDAVVAPYATALAAMIEPEAAVANFAHLAAAGAQGRHGFYEALDYTPSRVPAGRGAAVVRAFMAHHQGMTVTALANALLGGRLRERFHADPLVQAAELLLHERMPRDVRPATATVEGAVEGPTEVAEPTLGRRFGTPHGIGPATHLLSNGRYSVLLTAAGAGYSRWGDQAVTRWREDGARDDWGAFVYLRDSHSGQVWSAGYQPTATEPSDYGVTFFEDRAEYWRRDGALLTELTVLVSAEDDAELRRVTLTNNGDVAREIEVTSYCELALAPDAADAAHPAFSKLFVQTEHLPTVGGALLATRRRRGPDEAAVWAAHLAICEGDALGKPEFETDRARFLGRGRDARAPLAIVEGRPLGGQTGAVLDPIFALRRRLRIPPGGTARVSFWTFAAGARDAILDVLDQHLDTAACERAATLAWTRAQVQLRHLGVTHRDAEHFQRLAGHLIYAAPLLRPPSDVIAAGAGAQPDLWPLGISGDLPLILLRIDDLEHLAAARDLLHAAEYWRMKRLAVDVVILNERAASYVQDLQAALEGLVRATQSRRAPDEDPVGGSVFVLRGDLVALQTQARLVSAARVVLSAQRGRLR
ncbi:glucoamylase family protein, partial [Phenylobacterium sp. CCH9-H3]